MANSGEGKRSMDEDKKKGEDEVYQLTWTWSQLIYIGLLINKKNNEQPTNIKTFLKSI